MAMSPTAIMLMARYWPDKTTSGRKPPWTWSALAEDERFALDEIVTGWVASHNDTYAVSEDRVIPACWRQHPWLTAELATITFLWWSAHLDPTATVSDAGEFYLRYLPGFHDRLQDMLGRSPGECRRGEHPTTWRRGVENLLDLPTSVSPGDAPTTVSSATFGFDQR
jgi:hypothetical protein